MFDAYLTRWDLIPDGSPIGAASGRLLPVRHKDVPAILKLSTEEDERLGGVLMEWWDGEAQREYWLGTTMLFCWNGLRAQLP